MTWRELFRSLSWGRRSKWEIWKRWRSTWEIPRNKTKLWKDKWLSLKIHSEISLKFRSTVNIVAMNLTFPKSNDNSITSSDKIINSKRSYKMPNKPTLASIKKIKNSEEGSNFNSVKPPNESPTLIPKSTNSKTKIKTSKEKSSISKTKTKPSKEKSSNFKPSSDKNMKSKPAEGSPTLIKTSRMLQDKIKNSEEGFNSPQDKSMIWEESHRKWKKIISNLSKDWGNLAKSTKKLLSIKIKFQLLTKN